MGYVHVKAHPGSNKTFILEKSPDHFEIWIREKSERNKANARIIEVIAGHFAVPVSSVRIVNGHKHAAKLLVVEK